MTASTGELDGSGSRRAAPSGMRRRKLRPGPSVSRSWSWRYALIAYAVVLMVDFVLAIALPRALLRVGIGSLMLDGVMLAALIPLYRARPFVSRDLGLRVTAPARAVGLTFGALVAYVAFAAVWALLILGQRQYQITPQLHSGIAGRMSAGVALCCAAPVIEEIFFRGLLYRALRNRLNVPWSVAIGAVLFAAAHASTYPADTLVVKAAFGVIACLLYERTGSLFPGIALHCLIDSTGYEASMSRGHIWIVPAAFALLALAILVRHRFRPPTAADRRAARQHLYRVGMGLDTPVARADPSADPHRPPRAGRVDRVNDTLLARRGLSSPRRVLMITGTLLTVIAFVVLVATGPYAHHQHSARGGLLGLAMIIGVLMILTAVAWRLCQRPVGR